MTAINTTKPYFKGYPVLEVQAFVNKGTGKFAGTHFASIAWQTETDNDGNVTTYTAWFAPHNQPGTYHRTPWLDAFDTDEIMACAKLIIERKYGEEEYDSMGITSQYVKPGSRNL